MRSGIGAIALSAVLVAVGLAATVASATDVKTRPHLAKLALRQSDLPGSTISRQAYVKDADYVATYEREFDNGRFRALRLNWAESDVALSKSLANARQEIRILRTMFIGPGSRPVLERVFKEGVSSEGVKVLKIQILRARSVPIGDEALDFAALIRATGIPGYSKSIVTIKTSWTEIRVGRVIADLYLDVVPDRSMPASDVVALGKLFEQRIRTGLASGL